MQSLAEAEYIAASDARARFIASECVPGEKSLYSAFHVAITCASGSLGRGRQGVSPREFSVETFR